MCARALTALLASALVVAAVAADDVRPVQIQIREQEPNAFLVEWQVPRAVPRPAVPVPRLPEACRPDGETAFRADEASWRGRRRYRCAQGIAGGLVGLEFPFGNPSMSTVLRVELLDGERYAHMLAPGVDAWTVPGSYPHAILHEARRAVADGALHAAGRWLHLALALAFVALGGPALVGRFSAGHVGATFAVASSGLRVDAGLAELGLALGTALLAREALRSGEERRQVRSLAVAAGVVHGLGLESFASTADPGIGTLLLVILGMDAALLVTCYVLAVVARFLPWRRGAAYVAGVFAVAAAVGLLAAGPGPDDVTASAASRLPPLATSEAAEASKRLAPRTPDAPVQSFLAIGAFEVRQETLVRLADVAEPLGLRADEVLDVEAQASVRQRVGEQLSTAGTLRVDGVSVDSREVRVDFVTVSTDGVLPREAPVAELVADAFVGHTVSYLTPATPQRVELSWPFFPVTADSVPVTFIDPESTRTVLVTRTDPTASWVNALAEDPIPTVRAVAVEPETVSIPWLSLPLLALAFWLLRREQGGVGARGSWRVALAAAALLAPTAAGAVALPFASPDSPASARGVVAGLLPNLYRAFEFRDESEAYDRLALSVTGDALTTVYLEHRRALEMEERGGAQARVEAVEVLDVSDVAPRDDGGFDATASWIVGGTVTHFGHRHFRQNRYEARVAVVPVESRWRFRAVEILSEERAR